jgi:hypothetical protein
VFAVFIIITGFALSINSTTGEFSLTPDALYLNWTNNYRANVTVIANSSNSYDIVVGVNNYTTGIRGNYSQNSFTWATKYYWGTGPGCFYSGDSTKDNPLLIQNETGYYTNTSGPIPNGTNTTFIFIHDVICPPGRYYGNVTVLNITNSTENANVTITIDVPISSSNELNTTTGIATFKGVFPAYASAYHSYYFNTSSIENKTSLVVTLNWSSSNKDLDLFLFDDTGNMVAKSININTNTETIRYDYLPENKMWEVRIYGNISSNEEYVGKLYFITLNATDSSNNNTLTNVDLGFLNVSESQQINVTLTNQGGIVLDNVTEIAEIYHLNAFNAVGTNNFTFVVPSYATKIRVSVNWTGDNYYNLTLYRPEGSVEGTSTEKYINANISLAEKEEFVETTNITKGIWKVEIINNTNATNQYTVMAKFWVNTNEWVNSTYNTTTFNTSGNDNYTLDYVLNITIPTTSLSGYYRILTRYTTSSGAALTIPIGLNVTSAILLVNNTLGSDTIVVKDNTGFNRTGSSVLQLTIPIANRGDQNITFEGTSNSTNLSYGSHTINFTYSYPASIISGGTDNLSINISINTEETGNTAGIYSGWIYLNATEAYPYQGFNLTLRVNLTNYIRLVVASIETSDGNDWKENNGINENTTVKLKVYYVNGTVENTEKYVHLNNFSFWLTEGNVSSHRIPSSGYLSKYNGSTTLYVFPYYWVNVTIPSNQPGGYYYLHGSLTMNVNGVNLSGATSGYPLVINDTGLHLANVDSVDIGNINEGSYYDFDVAVRNYGPYTADNAQIQFHKGTCPITISTPSFSGSCASVSGGGSNGIWTIDLAGNTSTPCYLVWRLTGNNVSSSTACSSLNITVNNMRSFNNITGISLTVVNLDTTGDSTSTTTGTTGASCTTNANCADNYYCKDGVCTLLVCSENEHIVDHKCVAYVDKVQITDYEKIIYVKVGGTNKTQITVKNTGDRRYDAKLNVTIGDGISYSINSESCPLTSGAYCAFTVTFNVSNDTLLGNHSGTFKAYKLGDTSVYDSKSFTLFVLPTEERQLKLKKMFSDFQKRLETMENEYLQIKTGGFVSEANATAVEILINRSKSILSEISSYLNNEDYVSVESGLLDLNITLERIKSKIESLKLEKSLGAERFYSNIKWILIGVIIIAVVIGLIIYTLLPPEGYHVKYGYTPKGQSFTQRIKKTFKEILEKVKIKKSEEHVYRQRK